MNVKVSSYWSGNNKHGYQLGIPVGNGVTKYERLLAYDWDRKTASKALDLVSRLYKVSRENIRFIHK
jgi:hypothetical protein